MFFPVSLVAQHIFIPGNTHGSTVNSRGVGVGTDSPEAKLHIKDRFDKGTALLIDVGVLEYPILGGGIGFAIPDYAMKVQFKQPSLGPPNDIKTVLSIDKDGRIQAGFSNPSISDRIAALGSMGVYSSGSTFIRFNFDDGDPQILWRGGQDAELKFVNSQNGTTPLRITRDGKIGVNTDDFFDDHTLYISGSAAITGSAGVYGSGSTFMKLDFDSGDPEILWRGGQDSELKIANSETGTVPLRITSDGKIGV